MNSKVPKQNTRNSDQLFQQSIETYQNSPQNIQQSNLALSILISMEEENQEMISQEKTKKNIHKSAFDMKPSINVNFQQKFEAIDKGFKPTSILSMISDQNIKKQIRDQQLQFDYGGQLPILSQETQKNFYPHQRRGPYHKNLRKNLAQLKQLYLNEYKSICISYNKFSTDQIKAFFHSLKNYYHEENQANKLTSLYAAWVRVDRIVEYLSFKRFNKLKILNIGGNFIQTIEPLCRVYLPQIQDVFLWNNHIVQLRSLRKTCWPNLRVLDLHSNMIIDFQELRHLANFKLQNINLDSNMFSNIDELIMMSSKSGKVKISLMNNNCIKYLRNKPQRRRRKASEVHPCLMRVKYI